MLLVSNVLPVLSFLFASIISFSVIADIDTPLDFGMETIVLTNARDVPSVVAELTSELKQQGFTIPLIMDHSDAAANVDLELAPNQVIFARPPKLLEKSLLRKSMTIGLDLPMKFLVFEDADGNIKMSTNTLGYLIDRHHIKISDYILNKTNNLIDQFGSTSKGRQGLISIKSLQSVEDTVQALQDAISANPATDIPLILNYGKNKPLSAVLITFSNPTMATPLIQAAPKNGIDLPIKFLVWKDTATGEAMITYNDPLFLAKRVGVKNQNIRLEAIANRIKEIVEYGAGDHL